MRIVVIGLGHVGIVTTACLLHHGHVVLGIDIEEKIISRVSAGLSPIRETMVEKFLAAGYADRRLSASRRLDNEFNADLILVCVEPRRTRNTTLIYLTCPKRPVTLARRFANGRPYYRPF